MSYTVRSPILFIIFNRPSKTFKVFEQIRKVKPDRLYIAADGPRLKHKSDIKLCNEARAIINLIDWNCSIFTRFNDHNEGCKVAVSNGVSWFFTLENEGIILEDDCLPSESFFHFCDEILKHYRDNLEITHISGSNFQNGLTRGNASYYFSQLTHVWGWAGWKRSWEGYDANLKTLGEDLKNIEFRKLGYSKIAKRNLLNQLIKIKSGQLNTWDYQYYILNLKRHTFSIIPNSNLIQNIGFDKDATHTFHPTSVIKNSLQEIEFPLIHPNHFSIDFDADYFTLKNETPGAFKVYWESVRLFFKLIFHKVDL